MADQQRLTNWILAQQDRLDLQVTELTWINSYLPGWSDLEVTITVDGQNYSGRGADESEDVALGKATCEAIERYLCTIHGISSIGVAGHVDDSRAMEGARVELIERSLMRFHFENEVPMSLVSSEDIRIDLVPNPVKARIHAFKSIAFRDLSAVVCLAEGLSTGSEFGGVLGLGCDGDAERATLKARIECFRNLTALAVEPMRSITETDFRAIIDPSPQDRRGLLLDQTYCTKLLTRISGSCTTIDYKADLFDIQPAWQKLTVESPQFTTAPLHFYQCYDRLRIAIPHLEFVG